MSVEITAFEALRHTMSNRNVNASLVAGMFTHPAKSYVVAGGQPGHGLPDRVPGVVGRIVPTTEPSAAGTRRLAGEPRHCWSTSPAAHPRWRRVSKPGLLTIRLALAIVALTTDDGADSAPELFTAVTR